MSVQDFDIFDRALDLQFWPNPAGESRICDGLQVFHDGNGVEDNMAWIQNAEHALILTIYQFSGTYVSICADVPAPEGATYGPRHRLVAEIDARTTRPLATYARLNAEGADGIVNMVDLVVLESGRRDIPFDLSRLGDGASQIRKMWLDLILARPAMTEIALRRIGFRTAPGQV